MGESFGFRPACLPWVFAYGGLGDDDLAANGVIVDQGGPGVPQATDIPTLSAWGLLLLSVLLGLLGGRRRSRHA